MPSKPILCALALALLSTLPAPAQLDTDPLLPDAEPIALLPFEQVLRNYYEAIGGEEAWEKVESFKMTGIMQMGPGMLAPFTVYSARPDRLRIEFTFNGMTGVQAIDGEEAWMVMPFMGKTTPEAMPADLTNQLRDLLDLEGALVNPTAKGHTLTYLGPGQAQGKDAYKIKATLASGAEQVYYLDSEDFMPFFVEGKATVQGVEVETEIVLRDYEEVNGLMLAHVLETRIKGQPGGQLITLEEIEVNPDVGEIDFSMPRLEAAATAE